MTLHPAGLDARSSLRKALAMSWPASLTMLNATVLQFVDGRMVARIGPVPLAAQHVGWIWSYMPTSFALGMLTVVNTYVSQNLGAGRPRRCGQYAWAGMGLCLACWVLLAPLAIPARWLFVSLGYAEAAPAAMYFRYMILGCAPALLARTLEHFFYGVHRPGVVLVASVASNVVNGGLNYVLIFGAMGLPALGLQGAAIGTVTAWCVHLGILVAVFVGGPMHRQFATRRAGRTHVRQAVNLLRTGWPAGLQLINDILCWGVGLTVLTGMFGLAHRAATSIVARYMALSYMPAVGIASAATALVGHAIGRGMPDEARRSTRQVLMIAGAWMGACGAVMLILRGPLVDLFVSAGVAGTLSPAEATRVASRTREVGRLAMVCAAAFQIFDAMGIVYLGALRGAGDTRWPMGVTFLLSWGLLVGGGSMLVWLAPGIESLGPWLAATGYVFALGVLMAWRFESQRWRRIDLLSAKPGARSSIPG